MNKSLICIVCPNGCKLQIEMDEKRNISVSGNRCNRGVEFANTELTSPTRSITTTAATNLPEMPFLPVRTLGEIPKSDINRSLKELASIVVTSKVKCGDVIMENLAGTGIAVIATLDI